jgi:hypothetical protein
MWSHLPILSFMVMRDCWRETWRFPLWWEAAFIVSPWGTGSAMTTQGYVYLPAEQI